MGLHDAVTIHETLQFTLQNIYTEHCVATSQGTDVREAFQETGKYHYKKIL